jgi:carbon monoxide dehydrogenase subunit G
MALEITKTFVVKAAPAAVWAFLTDVDRVAKCMPGAAITQKIDDKTYAGTMTVKVGPVSTSYKGKVVFERLDPAAMEAEIMATGQDVKGKGGADMRMTSRVREIAPGETEVTATSKVNITGILAQMGRGMVQDVSDQLFQIFSQRMRAELETAAAPAPEAPPKTGPAAAAAPAPVVPVPAAPVPEVLDIGSIGAKAAGRAMLRTFTAPLFWIAVVAIAVVLYLLVR